MGKGFGGNMNQLMAQAQKMQTRLAALKSELKRKEVTAGAGGGMVTAVANGNGDLISIKIDPQVVDPNDVDMLQDLIVAAVGEVLREAQKMSEQEMGKITGGINIPGMF
jgi:nucleoid-associated protein EbfC